MNKREALNLSEQVCTSLRSMIQAGDIKPGERLIELHLTKAFNVSRTPVRQALIKLQEEGLVVSRGRRGFIVGHADVPQKVVVTPAQLEEVNIDQCRQWERIYASVERSVLVEVLFQTVRINELKLADYFGVSRTVTRDVLARMNSLGLIHKLRSGTWVADRLTPERVRDLYELRILLEPVALLQAAPRIDINQLNTAHERITDLLHNSNVDSASFDIVERDLHIDIVGLCPNLEIIKALERTHILFAPTRYLSNPVLGIPLIQIEDALREHLSILELLRDGDATTAAAELKVHLTGAVDRWLGRFAKKTNNESNKKFPPYLTVADND